MQHGRIRTCIEADFEVGGLRASGKIKNVSEAGAFIGTNYLPEGGENVELSFKGPGGIPVRVSGLVWWTTADSGGTPHGTSGFGLKLLEENDDYRHFLSTLTSWNGAPQSSSGVSHRRTVGRASR